MTDVVECHRDAAVKIHTCRPGLLSVQIPAKLILGVDAVLREMLHRGATSPELVLRRENDADGSRWRAEYGGISAWGVTPWAAMERLGNALRKDE